MYLSAQLHRTAVGFAHRRAGICVGAVPAVQRAPPAHAPQRAPPRSQRVAAWRVAASLPYGALPAVRAPRRASSRPPPSWRPPAPRESCAARAARARRPSSRPHRTRHPSKTPPAGFWPAGAGRKSVTDITLHTLFSSKGLGVRLSVGTYLFFSTYWTPRIPGTGGFRPLNLTPNF